MTLSGIQQNFRVYNAPDTTAHYAALKYLTPCERLLFLTYVSRGAEVLDLGVGGGRTTAFLSDRAARYVGVDYAASMVEACRQRFPGLEFKIGDAADLSAFPTASFDVVVFAFNGIDFVLPATSRKRCFEHVHRILKPGGCLIFSSHNARAIIVRPSWSRERLGRVARRFSAGSKSLFALWFSILIPARIVLAFAQALLGSVVRSVWRIPRDVFWQGNGEFVDSAHGGLLTHHSTPRCMVDEVEESHLHFERILGDDYPLTSFSLATDWYYYVFKKPFGN